MPLCSQVQTSNQPIRCKAAIVDKFNEPMKIEEVEVAPPSKGEVRVKILATGLCHSDLHVLEGDLGFLETPIILGHEAVGVVESVGPDVTSFKSGDTVIPWIIPHCQKCAWCKGNKTNKCQEQLTLLGGKQLDGTSRITWKGKPVNVMFAIGTFSEYIVAPQISLAKVRPIPKPEEGCLLGCAIPTGYGSAIKTAKMEPGSTCAVWGLGGVGLAAILGCRDSKASIIIGVDINTDKFDLAKSFGCTHTINPKELDKPLHEKIIEMTNGGVDYAIVSVGNVAAMNEAFKSTNPTWGQTVILGLAPQGSKIQAEVFEIIDGKSIVGSYMGGWRLKDDIPKLVDKYLEGKLPLKDFVSHTFSLDQINEGMTMLKQGKVIRAVVVM